MTFLDFIPWYHPVRKELRAERWLTEILNMTDGGFSVCSHWSQLKCFPFSSVTREHFLGFQTANANLFGCIFKNNYQITLWYASLFFSSTQNLSFSYIFLFHLASSTISISSAGTNLTPGFFGVLCALCSHGPQEIRFWQFTDTISCCLPHCKHAGIPPSGHLHIGDPLFFFLGGLLF